MFDALKFGQLSKKEDDDVHRGSVSPVSLACRPDLSYRGGWCMYCSTVTPSGCQQICQDGQQVLGGNGMPNSRHNAAEMRGLESEDALKSVKLMFCLIHNFIMSTRIS